MKILLLDIASSPERIIVGADSAILRHGEPLFMAEGQQDWLSAVVPAVRVGRLGLHIPRKAAASYIDAVTLFHVLIPPNFLPAWAAADRTFAPGTWLEDTTWPAEFSRGDISRPFVSPDRASDALALLSRTMTFKTGDIILFGDMAITRTLPPPRDNVRAFLGDEPVLDLKIR